MSPKRRHSPEISAERWGTLGWLAAWWAWTPLLYGLGWCLRIVTPGHRFAQSADQWFYVNFLTWGGLLWFWLTVGFIGTVVIVASRGRGAAARLTGTLAVLLALACLVQTWRVVWDDDKDLARYYAASATFYTPAVTGAGTSPSLARLLAGGRPGGNGCAVTGTADVPSCVKLGTLPTAGWHPRVSSYNGASYALSRSSGDIQNVSLNSATVHYLNAWHGQPDQWSGILDGKGISQGMGGVAEWNGAKVTSCLFTGRYAIDRSFGGSNLADLPDYLAERYPGLRWNTKDVWGYCDGSQPVVVIPVTTMTAYLNRSVSTAAGVILVHGASGKTSLTYQPTVKPGTLPGAAYPETLVDTQLTELSWAAGRGSKNNGGFGYQPTSSTAQAGNVSDYLLRSTTTGRLEWVTPLTLRNSSSQEFVGYAVSPADSVSTGQLNPLTVYIMAPDDPREINMEAEARNWLAQQQPGFISSGGQLLEFTPVGGNMWRAYGELNGRVVYLLDIDATGTVAPTLTSVSGIGGPAAGGGSGAAATAVCGKPLSSLSTAQLAFCLRVFADQLATREGDPAASPASSSPPSGASAGG